MEVLMPLKRKYLVTKNKSGGVAASRTGSRAGKKRTEKGLKPRRKAYGPF